MRLDFSIVSLPGNGINLTEYIFIEPSQLFFTASNWSTEVVLLVDGKSKPSFLMLPCSRDSWDLQGCMHAWVTGCTYSYTVSDETDMRA